MASTARLPTSCSLATIGSRRAAMAAIGCAPPSGSRSHRGSAGLSVCRCSSTAGAQGGRKMEDYNTAMKRMMRNPYEYHHDLGMSPPIITPQDKDIEYWGIDFLAILNRCKEVGIKHIRRPAVDFDPDSLRSQLPKAVSALEWAISQCKGRVYVHCTAGLGRAPAVAIAYMFWFEDMDLNTAYKKLTSIRPCGPNKRAIRAATYDLAKNNPSKEPFETLPEDAFEGIADWERKLIQNRVRALRET
ncbi:unnamed protein product [Urochloa decumbens]|uniref:Tyrosine specific protein phosphatases domain-containing protein n=1 Tax=Urochloa decumbens TaxID=240449 RepID=A0ABC8VIY0_9POAL